MAAKEPARRIIQQVRPILSLDKEEARRRVINLYKAWYRTVPYIGKLKHQNNRFSCVTSERYLHHRSLFPLLHPVKAWTTPRSLAMRLKLNHKQMLHHNFDSTLVLF